MGNSIRKSRSRNWLCSLPMLIFIPRPSHRTVLGKVRQAMFTYSVGKSVVPKEIKAKDIVVIYGDGRN